MSLLEHLKRLHAKPDVKYGLVQPDPALQLAAAETIGIITASFVDDKNRLLGPRLTYGETLALLEELPKWGWKLEKL